MGDWAIALGTPYGLERTVTLGIVSSLHRNINSLGFSDKRLDLIQTDAAINPGNSGGPLVDAAGNVIGINTLVRSGPGAGLGFAIPINLARRVVDQLLEQGEVVHPYIGLQLVPLRARMPGAQQVKLSCSVAERSGALVQSVLRMAPQRGLVCDAEIWLSGLRTQVSDPQILLRVDSARLGEPLALHVLRQGRELSLSVKPAAPGMS